MARIFDAVYGYIELDPAEFELVNSPIFQRLHWIKQLGPLHTVFPSAQHSRFSHTLGVFYIVKKMIECLRKRYKTPERDGYEFRNTEAEELRFAALLHDIGHVPLSHVGETVLDEIVKEKLGAEKKSGKVTEDIDPFKDKKRSWKSLASREYIGANTKLHEWLSAEMVLHNEEIDEILKRQWPDDKKRESAKKKIAQIIVGRDETDVPTLLLHSELDADRLDYLLRDSFFTGVGYGKIELDYIISRLCIYREKDGGEEVPILCVEDKGLHTIEHFILGRFFLQTQVVYNRKVRLMDLLFGDVLKYMVEKGNDTWGIMDLQKFRDHIRNSKGVGKRDHLHPIYSHTDGEVFSKMRKLHELLDKKQKKQEATPDECYINDCIKIIMDGQIDDPIIESQKIIDLKLCPDYEKTLEDEANTIAKTVVQENGIVSERIKVNVVEQEVMRYKHRIEPGGSKEGSNREAVRIRYKTGSGKYEWKFAAKSNATILRDLPDKALLIFNVYYIPSKNVPNTEVEREKVKYGNIIKQAFKRFVQERFKDDLG